MVTCAISGDNSPPGYSAIQYLRHTLYYLAETNAELCFYSAGIGRFDHFCENQVIRLKKLYPQKRIQLILVLSQHKCSILTHSSYYSKYDDIILPAMFFSHHKNPILRRNYWIINQSDIFLTYVFSQETAAYKSLKYAQAQKITILNAASKPLPQYWQKPEDVYHDIWK